MVPSLTQDPQSAPDSHPFEYWETTEAGDVPEGNAPLPPGAGWVLRERLLLGSLTVFRWQRQNVRERARNA
jgi:hypothetical protein